MAKGIWYIHCFVCGEKGVAGPPHGTTCFACEAKGLNKQAALNRASIEYRERRNEQSRLCKQRKYATAIGRHQEIDRCHARRSTLYGNVTVEQWNRCIDYFDNRCAYCGVATKLTVDHIIPVSHFGANRLYNVVPACESCNCSKNAHNILEWYPKQPFYTEERLLKIHAWFGVAWKDMQKEVI